MALNPTRPPSTAQRLLIGAHPWCAVALTFALALTLLGTGTVTNAQTEAKSPAQDQARAQDQVPSQAEVEPGKVPPPASQQLPQELEGIGLEEKLDNLLPLDATFKDERGRDVKLGKYFQGDKPVILNLIYFSCPSICTPIINQLVDTGRDIDLKPGEDFDIITLSFDPREGPGLAFMKKKNYVEAWGEPSAANGWHFLTGSRKNIDAVADAVGFRYKWIEDIREYTHPSVIMLITPDGHVSRYLEGLGYTPKTLRLSLIEASEGKIGSPLDAFILYCFRYNASEGKYTPMAWRIMQIGATGTAAILAIALFSFYRMERARKQKRAALEQQNPTGPSAPASASDAAPATG